MQIRRPEPTVTPEELEEMRNRPAEKRIPEKWQVIDGLEASEILGMYSLDQVPEEYRDEIWITPIGEFYFVGRDGKVVSDSGEELEYSELVEKRRFSEEADEE